MRSEERPASGKEVSNHMKKTYGVCIGMLAMGLAVLGAPAGRAQSRMAANDASGASAESASNASATPAASSPADLDRRIEALESELSELRTELAAKKTVEQDAAAAPAPAAAATPAPAAAAAPQDKPADKVTVASLLGPTSVSGFVDAYYQANFNHPSSQTTGLRSFDFRDKSINLNMAELILDKAPDATAGAAGRTGYHVSLGFGDAMTAIDASERLGSGSGNNNPGYDQYLKEAYFSYLAPVGKGLQIDVGKFVTPMGAEVIESKDNWNYSRGILFSYAIPYFHFGARAKYTFNDKYSVTGFVLNGWNNVADNNTGKTYGFSFNSNPTKKVSYYVNYLAGAELPTGFFGVDSFGTTVNVNKIWRQTWDAVVTYNPTAKWSFIANFDYGRGDRASFDNETDTFSPVVYWTGGAAYAKYTLDDKDYVAARYEYYDDHDGYTTVAPAHTHFNEVTATYQRTIASYLLARIEYRRDMASMPYFPISTPAFAPVKYQNTASLGLIFLFDSRNAK